jgi:hypothetical protein
MGACLGVHLVVDPAAAQQLRLAPPDGHEVRLLAEVGEAAVDVVPELRNLQHSVGHHEHFGRLTCREAASGLCGASVGVRRMQNATETVHSLVTRAHSFLVGTGVSIALGCLAETALQRRIERQVHDIRVLLAVNPQRRLYHMRIVHQPATCDLLQLCSADTGFVAHSRCRVGLLRWCQHQEVAEQQLQRAQQHSGHAIPEARLQELLMEDHVHAIHVRVSQLHVCSTQPQ